MPKVHSKISSISKENIKVNSKSPEKTNTSIQNADNNITKKRKLSKIIGTTSKADVSTTNIRPTKFARKSISQTSKLYRPKSSLSTNGNTSILKATTSTTSNLTKVKTPPSTATSSPRTSLITKNSPRSSITKTPLSNKSTKLDSKTKPLSTHKTPSTIKKTVTSKTIIKTKTSSPNTTSTDVTAKKINKAPKSKYGVTLTKRPRRAGWDTKVK